MGKMKSIQIQMKFQTENFISSNKVSDFHDNSLYTKRYYQNHDRD